MPAYSEDRRVPAVRRLASVSKNEAAENSDLQRQTTYVRAREAIADERRAAASGAPRRRFGDLVKPVR